MNPTRTIRAARAPYFSMCLCSVMIILQMTGCSTRTTGPCKQATEQSAKPTPIVTVHPASLEPRPDYTPMEEPVRGTIYVSPEVIITNEHFQFAEAAESYNVPVVVITLSDEGGKKMGAFTKSHVGELVVILVDDSIKSCAKIMDVITTKIQITAQWTEAEAEELANALNP